MANTILTPTAVTRKAAMVLHQKLNFIGSIDRQYDDSFAKRGANVLLLGTEAGVQRRDF